MTVTLQGRYHCCEFATGADGRLLPESVRVRPTGLGLGRQPVPMSASEHADVCAQIRRELAWRENHPIPIPNP